jgi:hypothetical protein
MATTLITLFGSLMLLLGALWWVLRPLSLSRPGLASSPMARLHS